MSKLCQVLHAGREELRFIVHDAGIVKHVEELLDVLVGEVRHEDWLHQGRVGLYAALLTHLHGGHAFFYRGGVGLQYVSESFGHDTYRGIELHFVLQLLEKVEDSLTLVLHQQVLGTGLRCDEETGVAVGVFLEVGDELTQDAVGDTRVENNYFVKIIFVLI